MFLILLTLDYPTVYATARKDLEMLKRSKEELIEGNGSNGDLVECWRCLIELKSCSNEIVVFFMNGDANIGPECCRAIAVITHNCWPAMLTSLGFTAHEGDILRGYCDAAANSDSDSALAPSPTS
ncbi:egg cell-secreted protein 1.4-like [Senna tora]|uniref:Egg cell-secreted protein 1.4-like n=1 Tax=Senna tora TaxID=362788 RepID=A0A834WXK6_9FABA|nr:egg cell-secreted protein 1.4-like [Senna tora]